MTDIAYPHSLDAEMSVLGAMLQARHAVDAVAETGLSPDDFYLPFHGDVYRAIITMHDRNQPVDPVTLSAEGLDAVRLQELAGAMPSTLNAAHYARIVKETASKRDLVLAANDAIQQACDGTPAEDVVAKLDADLLRLQARATRNGDRVFTAKDLVAEYRDRLENPISETLEGVKPPFTFLVPLIGSRLYVLSGYTGHGKTAAALQFVGSGCEGGARVGFHSIEMSREDLTHRLVAARANVPYHDVRTGHLSMVHRQAVERELEVMSGWDFEVIDDEGADVGQIRRDQRAGKYDFLIIDHLHNISIKDKRHERQELEENVRRITMLAREFDIPVLLLCQLSREDKRNPFPRPTLASLKGTGAIEQLASHVWFIYRVPDENHQPTPESELIIAKNRYGGLGFKRLRFRGSQVRFTESDF